MTDASVGLQSSGGMDSGVGPDTLTSNLANMSKHQLYQLLSQMKDLIHQNQQQARQILIANPQLTKTLFQAQIMLGMVRAPETSPLANLQGQTSQSAQTASVQVSAVQTQGRAVITQSPPAQQIPSQQAQPQVLAQLQAQQPQGQIATTSQPNQPSFPFQQQPILSQALSATLQPSQSFPYQPTLSQEHSPQSNVIQSHSLLLSSATLLQHPQSLPQPMQLPPPPPPLPPQLRQLVAASQPQHQLSQGMGFHPAQGASPYHPQLPYQQQGGSQTSIGTSFQQMHPPLPSQPLPQHMFQMSRSDMSGQPSLGSPSGTSPVGTWNQPMASSGSLPLPQTSATAPIGHMVPGHHPYAAGPTGAPPSNHGYGQQVGQPQQLQPAQASIEAEQQKMLLQQVMNLTHEQINSLPPEQRQQVLQLQQAFRNQAS